jgi:hypothetical protein
MPGGLKTLLLQERIIGTEQQRVGGFFRELTEGTLCPADEHLCAGHSDGCLAMHRSDRRELRFDDLKHQIRCPVAAMTFSIILAPIASLHLLQIGTMLKGWY